MLLKYLNQLEVAVREAEHHPSEQEYSRCAQCVAQLEEYLAGQMEPVQRRGHEIMATLIPARLFARMPLQVSRSLAL
ncbi:hypothetical protein A11A3_16335 [Alcanivorax hongdengensis A-11-3]|uniref:Uncharacterized protein n=1 Tax=Alcanivorax hongdengensis A-11-3 TaxID=1177179 RepID=L0W7P5_9GAMM|nr:hypothetical protein [Alcanivorax hongdengensis]EKF72901.1 hypothetical protein A11A3_16335 [Alcanivorax hongdengensis A-11-3]